MHAAVDVHYEGDSAHGAVVLFQEWTAAQPCDTLTQQVAAVKEYIPGQFYLRELPVIVELIGRSGSSISTIVVDGYVDLDEAGSPGLGRKLFEQFDGELAVIGVAKSRFRGTTHAIEVCRGASRRPLFVTAAGIDAATAAQRIATMHGEHRLPTLLKLADRLAREP